MKRTKRDIDSIVAENRALHERLQNVEETLGAVQRGEVDALVVSTPEGEQLFTLSGFEKTYRFLIEEMKEGAVMLSDNNTVLYCNSGFAAIAKQPLDKIIGKNITDVISPTDSDIFQELLSFGRKGEGSKTGEVRLQVTDGTVVPTYISINSFQRDDVKTTFLVLTDLTQHMQKDIKRYTASLELEIRQRKKTEEELANTTERLRLLSETTRKLLSSSSPQTIIQEIGKNTMVFLDCDVFFNFLLDQEKQKLQLNAYFGVPDETAKAIEWLSLGEAVCGCSAQQRKRIICENIPNSQDHRADLVRSFGVKAYCANPIFSDDKVIGTLSFGSKKKGVFSEDELSLMQTVTAQVSVAMSRKKTEEILKELNETLEKRVDQRTEEVSSERQRLYNVLETLPSYVILLDRDYRVRFANKVFRESFGEDNGRRCHEYLFGKDQECEDCETYKVFKENKPQHWYWTGPNGHDYDIYDFPFKEADGSILILEMGIDITERKKLEKQLKDSERMITIGQTAGMVGHDIRNPLQAMISDVYLAKSDLESFPDGDAKENISESLDSIQKNVEYINKIVQDLQDYARPLAPAAKEIDLQGLIEEVLFKNGVPENVEASCKLTDEAKHVTSDADLLKRVLTNLVNNAVQAMPDGGKLTILAYKDKETADLIIDVEDSGCGIPESVKPNLFTPMFTTKSKGQGFGLAVVKRITESMGGTISFESVVDKGTTFRVRLPPPQRAKR